MSAVLPFQGANGLNDLDLVVFAALRPPATFLQPLGLLRGATIVVLEPTVIPGLDRALLELVLIFSAVGGAILILTISSIVGIVRAVRRRRRGSRSTAAVMLALTAFMITTIWLLYWAGNNILHNSSPLDSLLIINLILCLLPFAWLISAIRANRFAA